MSDHHGFIGGMSGALGGMGVGNAIEDERRRRRCSERIRYNRLSKDLVMRFAGSRIEGLLGNGRTNFGAMAQEAGSFKAMKLLHTMICKAK